jgi:hypothetical protein
MGEPERVGFQVNGESCSLSYHDAEIFAEQLLSYYRDVYMRDVNQLASPSGGSTDPGWVEGGESLSRKIEAVLTTAVPGPVVINAKGKEGDAAFNALRLSGPPSWDATSDRSCLFHALEAARSTPPPSSLGAFLRRLIGS